MARHSFSLPKLSQKRIESPSLCVSGYLLCALGLVMLPCYILGWIDGDATEITGIPMALGLVLGLIFILSFRSSEFLRPVNAVSMLGILWLVCFLFGMIPYLIYGFTPMEALFESASGFTAVGATVIPDVSVLPRSLLLWRQLSNWFGGIMVILLFMLLLPMVGFGSRGSFSNEMSGASGSRGMTVRVKDAALQFTMIYMVLTITMMLLMTVLGLDLFDAVCLTLPTVSTGGFSCTVSEFTAAMKVVIILFMFLGATNFYLHFRAIFMKKPDAYRRNREFMAMLLIIAAGSVLMFLIVNPGSAGSSAEVFLDSVFMTVSASSSACIISVEFTAWPELAQLLFFALGIIGGSAGSTASGIKIFRIVILCQYIRSMFFRILHPNNVRTVTAGESYAADEEVRSTLVVIMMFILTIVVFSVVFMAFGYSTVESITSVTSALSNLGLGVGTFTSSFESMNVAPQAIMVLLMWMGRLEIVTAIAILSPGTWREQIKDMRHRREAAAQ